MHRSCQLDDRSSFLFCIHEYVYWMSIMDFTVTKMTVKRQSILSRLEMKVCFLFSKLNSNVVTNFVLVECRLLFVDHILAFKYKENICREKLRS